MESQDAGSRDGELTHVRNVTYGEYILQLHFLVTTKSKIFLHARRFMWKQEAVRRRREPGVGLVGSEC